MRLTEDAEQRLLANVSAAPDAHLFLGAEPPRLGTDPYLRADGSILVYRDGLAERLHRALYRLVVNRRIGRRRLVLTCGAWGCQNPRHYAPRSGVHESPSGAALQNAGKSHCPYGHPYDGANLLLWTDRKGREHRACRACREARRAGVSPARQSGPVEADPVSL